MGGCWITFFWPMGLKQLSVCAHLSERRLDSGGKAFKRVPEKEADLGKHIHMFVNTQRVNAKRKGLSYFSEKKKNKTKKKTCWPFFHHDVDD